MALLRTKILAMMFVFLAICIMVRSGWTQYADDAKVQYAIRELKKWGMLQDVSRLAERDSRQSVSKGELIVACYEIINELTRRLHGYDEIARVLQIENAKMQKELKESLDKKEKK